MNQKIASAVEDALKTAALDPTIRIEPVAVPAVADAVTAAVSAQTTQASIADQPLGPQLVRYGISILGSILVGRGLVDGQDWPVISGALLALGPPVYRAVQTWLARRRAAS